jgi:hypothetical protein
MFINPTSWLQIIALIELPAFALTIVSVSTSWRCDMPIHDTDVDTVESFEHSDAASLCAAFSSVYAYALGPSRKFTISIMNGS